jgi:lipid-A-disaccharide synthase
MPGSRVKEVRMNMPTILDAATQLGPEYEYLLPVAPTLDPQLLRENALSRGITLVSEAIPALHHSRAAVVASGTATVEAAIVGTPFAMVYRVSPLTYALGKPRIKVPYFAMVNLIAGEKVVPELVQHDFTANKVVAELQKLLPDGADRNRMIEGLAGVRARLRSSNPTENPIENKPEDPSQNRTKGGTEYPSTAARAAAAILAMAQTESLPVPSAPSVATQPPNFDSK